VGGFGVWFEDCESVRSGMEHCSEVPEVNNGRVPNLGELDTPHDVSDNKKVRDVEENGELCSVCYECPDPLDEAMVPPCGHRFW